MCLFLISACKKTDEKEAEGKSNYQTEKLEFYKNKGYQYLFSIDRQDADSIAPIFFGKTSGDELRCLYTKFRNGSIQNLASTYNNGMRDWLLPGLDLSKIKQEDYYSITSQDFLKYRSRYYYYPTFYNEEDGNSAVSNYTSEFGGKSGLGDEYTSTLASTYYYNTVLKKLHDIVYTRGNDKIIDSFVYEAALFGFNNQSYFIYNKATALYLFSNASTCNIMVSDKNGPIFNRTFESDLLVDHIAYADDGVYEGKYAYLVETGTDVPLFVFRQERRHQYTFALLDDYKTELPFTVTFPNTKVLDLALIKFFKHKDQIYASMKNKLFKISKNSPMATQLPINLEHLAGIYGSPRQILLAIYNNENGLDIVQLQ